MKHSDSTIKIFDQSNTQIDQVKNIKPYSAGLNITIKVSISQFISV